MLTQKQKIQALEQRVLSLEKSIAYILDNVGLDGFSSWSQLLEQDKAELQQSLKASKGGSNND